MDDRIKIDNTIKEKSTDFYYSASDVYGISVFTDKFRSNMEVIIQTDDEKFLETMNSIFVEEVEQSDTEEAFFEQMFMGRQYESKYRDYKAGSLDLSPMALCLFASFVSLMVCFFLTYAVKKYSKSK